MIDPTFEIHREGKGILIRGQVPVSVQRHSPYLERIPDPDPAVHTYRVDYHQFLQGETETGCQMETVEFHEPELDGGVEAFRFRLADDREITIPNRPEPTPPVDPGM